MVPGWSRLIDLVWCPLCFRSELSRWQTYRSRPPRRTWRSSSPSPGRSSSSKCEGVPGPCLIWSFLLHLPATAHVLVSSVLNLVTGTQRLPRLHMSHSRSFMERTQLFSSPYEHRYFGFKFTNFQTPLGFKLQSWNAHALIVAGIKHVWRCCCEYHTGGRLWTATGSLLQYRSN